MTYRGLPNTLINVERVSLLGAPDVVKLPSGWPLLVWGILGFFMLLSGVISGNVVTIIVGTLLAFAATSGYLTSHVKSEHRVKKAWEVVSAIIAMAIVIYGYVITGSLILEVLTLFIAVMFFVAFTLSYLLPRIRAKPSDLPRVKDEGKEKLQEFAYDVGLELGREMGKGLEENWKRYVIAGVIAAGCGLFSILLKTPWYFIIMVVFISYYATYSALSKLSENKGERAKK
jgi:hypothetical protein